MLKAKKRKYKSSIELEIRTSVETELIKTVLERALIKGLDTEPFYVSVPKDTKVNIVSLEEVEVKEFPDVIEILVPSLTGVYYKGDFMYNISRSEEFLSLQVWALENNETENVRFLYVNPKGEAFDIGLNSKGELEKWPSGMADTEQKLMAQLVRLRKERIEKEREKIYYKPIPKHGWLCDKFEFESAKLQGIFDSSDDIYYVCNDKMSDIDALKHPWEYPTTHACYVPK